MTLSALSDLHQKLWSRWPVLALIGYYGFWLGLWGAICLGLHQAGWSHPPGALPVLVAMLASALMIVGYLKRTLALGEWLVGSLICTLLAGAYFYFSETIRPPTGWHTVFGFLGFMLIHLALLSPWFLRLLLKAREGSRGPAAVTSTRYVRFWTTQPLLATLAHYGLFLLTFTLLFFGIFSDDKSTGHPLRGFILVMLFVMPWLFALRVGRKPNLTTWLVMAFIGAALYWLMGYAAGGIHPDSPRQMLASVSVTLLYNLVMFSPWLVGLWLRIMAEGSRSC